MIFVKVVGFHIENITWDVSLLPGTVASEGTLMDLLKMVSPPNCHCQEFGGEVTVDILRSELTIPKYIPWDSQGSWIFYNS